MISNTIMYGALLLVVPIVIYMFVRVSTVAYFRSKQDFEAKRKQDNSVETVKRSSNGKEA